MSKKICIVAGARPNFIKVAPVIRAIENAQKQGEGVEYELVFTGREDDETLEDSLFSIWTSGSRMYIWAWTART